MALKQQLGLRQKLGLTAEMRQSIDVLGMSWAELVDMARREAAENPYFGWQEPDFVAYGGGASAFDVSLEQTAATTDPRVDVLQQIRLANAPDGHKRAAATLVGWLDSAGYLAESLDEVAAATNIGRDNLSAGHGLLRTCEPIGIGAKNLHDCLSMQLEAFGFSGPEVTDALAQPKALANGDATVLAQAAGLSEARAAELLKALQEASPAPLETLSDAAAPILAADVEIIRQPDGMIRAQMAGDRTAHAWVDSAAADSRDARVAQWKTRARSLVTAISGRNRTLLAVTSAILDRQSGWFVNPNAPLEPMRMADIAADMGVHPSTITRALAGKALSCDRGVVAFRAMFSTAIASDAGPLSADAVSRSIASMIGSESALSPLSDQKIAEKLRSDGVDISRRTVAKYRQCMKLPSTRQRRKRPRADLEKPDRKHQMKL